MVGRVFGSVPLTPIVLVHGLRTPGRGGRPVWQTRPLGEAGPSHSQADRTGQIEFEGFPRRMMFPFLGGVVEFAHRCDAWARCMIATNPGSSIDCGFTEGCRQDGLGVPLPALMWTLRVGDRERGLNDVPRQGASSSS